MPGYTEYVLAEGSFSYGQAVAVITAYRNVFIQDDPGMHFRRIPHISRKRTTPGCTRCHTRLMTTAKQNGFILQAAAICYVPMHGRTRFCGLNAWACQERSVVWSSLSPGVMASVSFIWTPAQNVCRGSPLSTGNP